MGGIPYPLESRCKLKKDVHIKLSESNFRRLKYLSKKFGITQTKVIEDFISDGKIVVINDLVEMQKQLRYIGNNLNQLTKLCHEGRIECLELENTKLEVMKIWQLLNLLMEKQN